MVAGHLAQVRRRAGGFCFGGDPVDRQGGVHGLGALVQPEESGEGIVPQRSIQGPRGVASGVFPVARADPYTR